MKRLALIALLLFPAVSLADQYDAERAAIREKIAALQQRLDYLNSLADTSQPPIPAPPNAVWNTDGTVTLNGVLYVPVQTTVTTTTTVGACSQPSASACGQAGARGGRFPLLRRLRHPFGGGAGIGSCGG